MTVDAAAFVPRVVCPRCRRPARVCWCRHLVSIPTRTRIAVLQHPRERDMAIGTARMASLCLPNSELHVGVRWHDAPALARLLHDPARPAALLYPGAGAIDVVANPPPGPITLVVVDGTWAQAKKIVRCNPELAALPRYAFVPPAPSEYRIRREPRQDYVSTIEALVHVLGALEGDPERFSALLVPFRAMIDAQIAFIERLRQPRARLGERPARRPRGLPAALTASSVVCVFGEANGWPHGSEHRSADDLAELLHLVALRVDTGEVFDATLAPRTPIAAGTPGQLELSEAELRAGLSPEPFAARWRAFVRDGDVLCAWGDHTLRLLAAATAELPGHCDLRRVAGNLENRRAGGVETYHRHCALEPAVAVARGRAGRRVAMLAAILQHLRDTYR